MLNWRSHARPEIRQRGTDAALEIDLAGMPGFSLGSISVEPATLRIVVGSQNKTIEPRVMQVLVALAETSGTVVSRQKLVDICWGGRIVSEDAINRCIAKVRRIGTDSCAYEIETIPRVGYRLIAANRQRSAGGASARFGRPILLVIAAIMILALAAGGFWYLRSSDGRQQPTVAVIPFTALNSDADARNFAESIADAADNGLAQTGARLPDNIRTAEDARKSGAALIISGAVRRDASTYRVTVTVDSAQGRSTILTNEFDAPASDAPALGGRVASWLIPPFRMWASFLPVEPNPAVTDEILRIFLTRGGGDGLRAWKLSRTLATSNPGSGSSQLVFALLTSDVLASMSPQERPPAIASARMAAANAVRLLPDPARAQAVLDCHLTAPGWRILTPLCDRRTRAAISATRDVPLLPFLFGAQLAESGRFLEAAKFVDMDLSQNPLGPGQLDLRLYITQMLHAGDADDVLPQLKERMVRYLGPGSTAYSDFRAAVANGNMDTAEKLLNDPRSGDNVAAGDEAETARLVLRAIKSRALVNVTAMRKNCNPPAPDWTPPDLAFETCLVGLTMMGDLDTAFTLAARGYRDVQCCSAAQQQQSWLATGGVYYSREQLFGKAMAPFRADRRFIEIARRTGLLAYWKSGHPPDFCSFERAPVCQQLN